MRAGAMVLHWHLLACALRRKCLMFEAYTDARWRFYSTWIQLHFYALACGAVICGRASARALGVAVVLPVLCCLRTFCCTQLLLRSCRVSC
jgi:hypothetical protein